MTMGFDNLTLSYLGNKSMWLRQDIKHLELVWFDGLVWFRLRQHTSEACFGYIREDLSWYGLVCFETTS